MRISNVAAILVLLFLASCTEALRCDIESLAVRYGTVGPEDKVRLYTVVRYVVCRMGVSNKDAGVLNEYRESE